MGRTLLAAPRPVHHATRRVGRAEARGLGGAGGGHALRPASGLIELPVLPSNVHMFFSKFTNGSCTLMDVLPFDVLDFRAKTTNNLSKRRKGVNPEPLVDPVHKPV